MNTVESIFSRLSEWRNLPDYQLERRADIFFACYLPDILNLNNETQSIRKPIVPEFPMRKGTLGLKPSNFSVKIDFLAVTEDLTKVFFIELKTETKSIDEDQCRRMITGKDIGIKKLLGGILILFKETKEKRKYYHLLQMIEQLGLISIPNSIQEIMERKRLNGINRLLRNEDLMNIDEWYIAEKINDYEICYILPGESEKLSKIDPNIKQITFSDVIKVVSRKHDEFSERFAEALQQWS